MGYQRREFYIVSEMHGKVVDIEGQNASPGARIIMYAKHHSPAKNQLWYQDEQGFIRSSLNDMVFSNQGQAQGLRTQPPGGDPRSQWMAEGNRISNRLGETLDIARRNHENGAELISYPFQDAKNQHWRLEFV